MAILWQKHINGKHYEVRTAGNSRRLYTDGVFHSQYNPNRALAGGIWDLLMLPAFFYAPHTIKRILVLGVGGGAVIHQLHTLLQPEKIIGIELDSIHLQIARRFFSINKKKADLHNADAVLWLKRYSGPRFDMIIDDLFYEQKGEPMRAVDANKQWLNILHSRLTKTGLLVMNFVGREELRQSAYFENRSVNRYFSAAFQFSRPYYANSVGVFLKKHSDKKTLRSNIKNLPKFNLTQKSNSLKYRVEQLK